MKETSLKLNNNELFPLTLTLFLLNQFPDLECVLLTETYHIPKEKGTEMITNHSQTHFLVNRDPNFVIEIGI